MLIRALLLFFLAVTGLLGPAHAAEPLPPDQAYRFSARVIDARTLEAHWQIADGYYMYREKFKFTLEGGELGAPVLPPGKIKDDELFGKVETYRHEVAIRLPVTGSGKLTLKAVAQGCWDGGICYPPQNYSVALTLPAADLPPATLAPPAAAAALPAVNAPLAVAPARPAGSALGVPTFSSPPAAAPAAAVASTPAAQPPAASNETARIAGLLKGGGLMLTLATFFGFGLLLSLTPCVFPMIPILSGIIVNHGHAVTHLRAFVLSLAYVLGMALTYAAVGVAAGLSGTLLSAALQNAWVLGSFALIFVVLSLSMFGFYELQLPTALQSRLSATANRQGGSLPAIASMGALSALIVGPCVAAPLAGALLYIAQTGNAALGGAALFALALGMGAPLLLVGTFSRSLLPRPGPWMEGVKQFFGVLMLATALWLVSPVLPGWLAMLGWALLLILPAIYLSALDPLPHNAHGWQRFGKGLGVVLLLCGALLLVGLLGGAQNPLQPLSFLRGGAGAQAAVAPAPTFQRVASVAELDARIKAATAAGRPVMLDFWAEWCISCKEMEAFTFTDPRVAAQMKNFVLLQADVTANNAEDKALLARFELFGPPGIIFFDRQGTERPELRIVGYQPAEKFLPTLAQALR
ncbi:MAG: protein-disulfide reductase DsbD [Rugosibacter sp.]|nr:protein-disulfide reductase DsbD [Rugosibacter sp.]